MDTWDHTKRRILDGKKQKTWKENQILRIVTRMKGCNRYFSNNLNKCLNKCKKKIGDRRKNPEIYLICKLKHYIFATIACNQITITTNLEPSTITTLKDSPFHFMSLACKYCFLTLRSKWNPSFYMHVWASVQRPFLQIYNQKSQLLSLTHTLWNGYRTINIKTWNSDEII